MNTRTHTLHTYTQKRAQAHTRTQTHTHTYTRACARRFARRSDAAVGTAVGGADQRGTVLVLAVLVRQTVGNAVGDSGRASRVALADPSDLALGGGGVCVRVRVCVCVCVCVFVCSCVCA